MTQGVRGRSERFGKTGAKAVGVEVEAIGLEGHGESRGRTMTGAWTTFLEGLSYQGLEA